MNMCSISVEPMPSRMSTPVLSFQRLPMSAGNASPAETQRRSVSDPSFGNSGLASIAPYSVGAAVENRGFSFGEALEYRRRRRTLGHKHGGRAGSESESLRVAEAVRKGQLRRGKKQVVLGGAED